MIPHDDPENVDLVYTLYSELAQTKIYSGDASGAEKYIALAEKIAENHKQIANLGLL